MIKCFNTVTREYQEVELSADLEQEIKRSYWREDQQERRYYKRMSELNENLEYGKQFRRSVEESIILSQEIEVLKACIRKLTEKEKFVVHCVYYGDLNNVQTAKLMGVSSSYVGKILKGAKSKLKALVLEEYDYYV